MQLLEVGDRVEVEVPNASLLARVVPQQTMRGTVRSILHLGKAKAAKYGPVHYMVRLDAPLDATQCSGNVSDMFETGMSFHSDGRSIVIDPRRVRHTSPS